MNGNIWHIWLSARNLGVIIDSQLSLDALPLSVAVATTSYDNFV